MLCSSGRSGKPAGLRHRGLGTGRSTSGSRGTAPTSCTPRLAPNSSRPARANRRRPTATGMRTCRTRRLATARRGAPHGPLCPCRRAWTPQGSRARCPGSRWMSSMTTRRSSGWPSTPWCSRTGPWPTLLHATRTPSYDAMLLLAHAHELGLRALACCVGRLRVNWLPACMRAAHGTCQLWRVFYGPTGLQAPRACTAEAGAQAQRARPLSCSSSLKAA
mmetsp:Transcript_26174/g.87664  ORF Transcript_26174/g.87664 Transcript_26174/m.87664 type:complete len:219 (+) Transcript_26174:722-1378(+)